MTLETLPGAPGVLTFPLQWDWEGTWVGSVVRGWMKHMKRVRRMHLLQILKA